MPAAARSASRPASRSRLRSLIGERPPNRAVVLPDLLEPLPRDAAPRGDVLQERHDVLGPLRAAERDEQQGVVRRDVGTLHAGESRSEPGVGVAAPSVGTDALVVPLRAVPTRGPSVLRRRPGRAAAVVDGRARDAAAGAGRVRLLRPRRVRLGGLHGRQRDRRPPSGPPGGCARAGPGAGARQPGVRVGHGRPRRHGGGRLAALVDLRRRGRGRRHPAADRRLRPHPLGPRPRPARRGGDRLRVRGRRRRVRLHRRADPGHPAGHPGRPDRRHRGHRGGRRGREPGVRRPARHRATGASRATGPPGPGCRCPGGPWRR